MIILRKNIAVNLDAMTNAIFTPAKKEAPYTVGNVARLEIQYQRPDVMVTSFEGEDAERVWHAIRNMNSTFSAY